MDSTDAQPAPKPISSPAATGGAGTLYEQHVDASFLALLLVGAIPPVLLDCVVTEVHFQTERLGWATDDLLVVGVNGAGMHRRLLSQVKISFTISASDDDCKKTIIDFWQDFRSNRDFSTNNDRFAIITQRGTNTFLHHFGGLLDCARVSQDAADFEQRLRTPGFVHKTAVRHFAEIQEILNEHEQRIVPIGEVWQFLKLIHALSFDLNTSTAHTEAQTKNFLAHASNAPDPKGSADATWNELLRLAGGAMPHAKGFRRDDLPQQLRERHLPIMDSGQAVIRRLEDHSTLILNGIRTKIGPDVHLRRDRLVQALLERLEATQIVIVTGPAGCGKSGIAKDAIRQLNDNFTFSFRAEEFATPHLDQTLHNVQIPTTAVALGAILAGQNRKLLLVESVERLLEASTRDAFSDLLTMLQNDQSWRLVLTCRDYSSELVRSSLLQLAEVAHSILEVPPLDDDELNGVGSSLGKLSRPLANPRLRALLRNPYFLDKASQMEWPDNRPLPENERAFRAQFWTEVIRAEDRTGDDMPRRRQDAFIEIALRRARALTQYISRREIDSGAVQVLRQDSLLSVHEDSDLLVAPAHDVLEDWAILEWIEEQYALGDQSLTQLATTLGTYPAIRRTYRKWVTELVEQDATVADRLFISVIVDQALSPQFRDDTLVSLLQSAASTDLLQRHATLLLAHDRQLLRRIIHLLRVGCVTTPPWFGGGAAASLMHVPDGAVWESVLGLLASSLEIFNANDLSLLLGFIDDASRGVSWHTPYPDGSHFIATIAYWLLPQFDEYRAKDQRRRVLQIIAKLPNCNPQEFARLLEGDPDHADERDRASEQLRELVLWEMEGMPASRDLPNSVLAALRDEIVLTEEAICEDRFSWGNPGVESAFGIKHATHFHSYPASAIRGPFLFLLRHHPALSIDFLTTLFNQSANWYGVRRVPIQYVEPPFQITLTFADGTTPTQWCNARLWNLYRGTSVGPYVLQSALMALENWLLAYGEGRPRELDHVLCGILQRSRNAAITAVVASVATAFPRATPETLLVLLSSPECVLLDRQRLASESQAAAMANMMPFARTAQRAYDNERKESNALPHRRHDLEAAIANVQLGAARDRVENLIDDHLRTLPPPNAQTDDDRIWRLALHRMDLRKYTVASSEQENSEDSAATDVPHDSRRVIRLDLVTADPDVQQMADATNEQYSAMSAQIALLMWGMKVFSHEEQAQYDPSRWRMQLQDARAQRDGLLRGQAFGVADGGPEYVASVCIRDHFDEMSSDEAAWCTEVVCDAVESQSDDWNDTARVQRHSMQGDRPSAFALSCLVGRPLTPELHERLRNALAYAMLHPVDEVRGYAAAGVGQYLWASEPGLAIRCINVLAEEATAVQERLNIERQRPFDQRVTQVQIEYEVGTHIRDHFYDEIVEHAYDTLDTSGWIGSEANCHILAILGRASEQQLAIDAFRRLAHVVVEWWDDDDERRSRSRREHSSDVEIMLTGLLEEFVLRVTPEQGEAILEPLLDAVDRHPRNTSHILQGITEKEDRLQKTAQFWHLWQLFANRVKTASWLPDVDQEHSSGGPVLAAVFLTRYWKDDVEHWRSLEGHAFRVDQLFQQLPPSAAVLDNYTRFLYHVGKHSLPMAFQLIEKRLRVGHPQDMLKVENAAFILESLLGQYVYGRPMELKRDRALRDSVLYLLDILVENGSSAAYRMRDDFVTPIA